MTGVQTCALPILAVIVSACNQCEYCQEHHAEALNHYWKDEEKVAQIRKNYKEADLEERELRLCEYAELLTLHPGSTKGNDPTELLRHSGLSDNAILDATLVISYFNFVNRIVLSLDVALEKDSAGGYNY